MDNTHTLSNTPNSPVANMRPTRLRGPLCHPRTLHFMTTNPVTLTATFFLSTWLAHADFRAGIAVRVVTPDTLLPVSGGIGPSKPTTKKEGDLTVRAFVLAEGNTKVAIVSADFLGFPAALGNRVRRQVSVIPAENILIGATHTHSAPDCYGFPDGKGGTGADLAYLESVCLRMAQAINEAATNLRPATLKISQ